MRFAYEMSTEILLCGHFLCYAYILLNQVLTFCCEFIITKIYKVVGDDCGDR